MGLQEDIAKFTTLVQDWSIQTSDLFYSNVAQDITVKIINELGTVTDITVPNQKKMQETFEAWKAIVNVKNTNGVLTDDSGADVSVNKFGGLTLTEYNSLYASFFNKVKIKLVPDTKDSQMVGFYLQAFVTEDNKVLAWGWNSGSTLSYGLTVTPLQLFELQQDVAKKGVMITKIFVSGQHIGILYEDGDLYLRGVQALGHFGIGNIASQIKFVLSATNVVEYITSSNGDQDEQPMAAIILEDGSVMTAGDNGHGELGIGSVTNTYSWTKIYDAVLYQNDKAIKVMINGDDIAHMAILTASGKLFVSGYNGNGQLGNGTVAQVNTLTQIVPNVGVDKIIDIVASGYYDAVYTGSTFILTNTGRVFSTGYNGQGQLGSGNLVQKNSFSEVVYAVGHDVGLDPVKGIYAFNRTSAYLTESGELYAVGQNANGSIGNGAASTNLTAYVNILNNVERFYPTVNADASQYPALYATTNDGKLFSWGNGAYGQLGHYSAVDVLSPTEVRFNYSDEIKDITHTGYANEGTVFIQLNDGSLYGCGQNNYGQACIYSNTGYVSEFVKVF